MCGIFMVNCLESTPTKKQLDILFTHAEKRGSNGTGIAIIDRQTNETRIFRYQESYSEIKDNIMDEIYDHIKFNSIIFGICRNMPETETNTDEKDLVKTLQPIYRDGCILIHNGAISEKYIQELKNKNLAFETDIDSEAILVGYINNQRNMRNTIEEIDGGMSAILYDFIKKRMIIISSFLPLAQSYARGLGYVIHSSYDALHDFLADYKNMKEVKYMRTWEDFYFDELQPFTVYEMDMDSQLVNSYNYKHKFSHPTWMPNKNSETLYLVLASSGIDSTTTMLTLKELGCDVHAVHFKYNQKSQDAEELVINKIIERLDIKHTVVDLNTFYDKISSSSMLLNDNINVTTAGNNLKSTIAWVPARNLVFASLCAAIADELILTNLYGKVLISGGFSNISEESTYVDNSQRFVDSLQNVFRHGTLSGTHGNIKWINPFAGLTKKEELFLMKYFGYEDLFGLTVSCDRAKVIDGEVYQCSYNGYPACGSGLLSKWAAELVGIKDNRKYYEVDEPCEIHIPKWKSEDFKIDFNFEDIKRKLILE